MTCCSSLHVKDPESDIKSNDQLSIFCFGVLKLYDLNICV